MSLWQLHQCIVKCNYSQLLPGNHRLFDRANTLNSGTEIYHFQIYLHKNSILLLFVSPRCFFLLILAWVLSMVCDKQFLSFSYDTVSRKNKPAQNINKLLKKLSNHHVNLFTNRRWRWIKEGNIYFNLIINHYHLTFLFNIHTPQWNLEEKMEADRNTNWTDLNLNCWNVSS
jgi:hypothetical protein